MKLDPEFLEEFRKESIFDLSDSDIEKFISAGEVCSFPANASVIKAGEVNTNLYILKKGIARINFINEEGDDVTVGFGMPYSLVLSPVGFLIHKPAFYSLVTCTDFEVYRIRREKVMQLMEESPQLARWLLGAAIGQFSALEIKRQFLSGTPQKRYHDILHRRDIDLYHKFNMAHPSIAGVVPEKMIASYLGIHPVYFSRMKREMFKKKGKSGE